MTISEATYRIETLEAELRRLQDVVSEEDQEIIEDLLDYDYDQEWYEDSIEMPEDDQ